MSAAGGVGLSAPAAPWARQWRAAPLVLRVLGVFLGAAVLYQVGAGLVSGVTGSADTPTGSASSLQTGPRGTAALARLLALYGHPVSDLTAPVGSAGRSATLLVLAPTGWSDNESRALAARVRAGGTVVVAGRASVSVLRALISAAAVSWRDAAVGPARVHGASSFTRGVTDLASPAGGAYILHGANPGDTVATGPGGDLAVVVHDGGWLVALASASPLEDRALASADNAAFALNLAGPVGTPVLFDEYDHGIGRGGAGLAGLPAPWRFGLAVALAAVAVGLVSAARRFGPPARSVRTLPPPRAQFVRAVATTLAARRPSDVLAAAEPVTTALRATLADRLGLPDDATDDAVRAAAARAPAHLSGTARRAATLVTTPLATSADVVAAGRELAALSRSTVTQAP